MPHCDPEIKRGKRKSRFEIRDVEKLQHKYCCIISDIPEICKHEKKSTFASSFHVILMFNSL